MRLIRNTILHRIIYSQMHMLEHIPRTTDTIKYVSDTFHFTYSFGIPCNYICCTFYNHTFDAICFSVPTSSVSIYIYPFMNMHTYIFLHIYMYINIHTLT